jgi:hypothetical protein
MVVEFKMSREFFRVLPNNQFLCNFLVGKGSTKVASNYSIRSSTLVKFIWLEAEDFNMFSESALVLQGCSSRYCLLWSSLNTLT